MKKILFFLLSLFLACVDPNKHDPAPDSYIVCAKGVVIEGCEYWQYRQYSYYAIEHKGNCKNPIHCYNTPNEQ